jgi:hypothetical protein
MPLLPGGFRPNEKMQHGPIALRRLVLALVLALVAGARTVAAETLGIQWDPNPEAEVIGYRVFIGSQPGVYDSQVDVGNVTSYSLNAVQGRQYCFAVAAFSAGPTVGTKSLEVCTDSNRPPTLQSPGNQTSGVGTALTLTLNGSDPEGLPITYSATGLPAGLTLNANTGFISGTPTAVATTNVTVTVSDGVLSTSHAFTWTISASLPGAATPLRPTGTLNTATPTFEWESVTTATSYRLWVDDASSTDPKIQLDLTPTQAGCVIAGAVCRVSPGVTLQAGRGSWSVRASNLSGPGPWSGAMDFTVPDVKVPTVTIATPTSASSYSTSATSIALGGTATDDAGVVQVTWTNNLGGSGTATGTSSWSVAAVAIKVGTNVITVTARDAGGNIATDVLTVTKTDGDGPAISILQPAATSFSTTNGTLAMSGSASDDGGSVTQVTWVSDRGGSGTAAGTTAWSIASIALKPGANVIAVTAHDNAGNKTTKSFNASLTDGEAPTVTIASPTAAAAYSTGNETVALGGTASDTFGVTLVSWTSDRGASGTASGTTAWSVAAAALKPGANVITVTARDAAGNTSTDSITVTMTDGAAPVVAIAAPTAAASFTTSAATLALGGTASDAFGVTQVSWASDKGGAGAATGTTAWSVASVALEIGVNVITVTARDAAGNAGTDVLTVTRTDGVAPTVSIATPASGSTFSTTSSTIALGGTAADNVGVAQVSWSNSKGGNGVAAGTTAWAVASVTLQPGSNVITVTAKDAAGNVATDVLTVTFTDAVAPTVSITAPTSADKHTTTAATMTLGGTASDVFGVTEVRWSNDRGGAGVAGGTTSWSAAVPLLPGVNVLTVTASDAAGNTSSDRISVTSDGKAPVMAIASPASNSVTKNETVTLSGTSSDDLGVTEVNWSNNRGGSGRATGTTSWSVTGAALQSGINVITVVAQDAAGNRTSATVSVTLDSQAPVVAFVVPAQSGTFVTNKASIALGGKAADNTGVTQVTWQSNRGGAGTAAGTTEWAVPAVALLSGPNVITVTARDAAGNVGTTTLTVVLDTRAPVVAITTPTSAAAFSTNDNSIALAGAATDDVALAEVTWSSSQGGSGVAAGTTAWSGVRIALKPGLNTITVTARDTAGNTASATLAVRATDVKAPAVRIVAPSSESSFSTSVGVINLEGQAIDDFGVARISWVSDRGASGVAKGTDRWIVGGIALQPGVNVLTVTAVDASGNSSTDAVRIAYERGLPSLSLTSPTTAATYTTSSSSVALTGVASDDNGIARVRWSTDKGQVGDAIGTTAWSIPSVTVTYGTTVVTVTAYDNSGNTSSLTLSIVYADTTKPVVKIYTPTTAGSMTTSMSSVTVAGTATDNVGVTQVTWATDRGVTGAAFGAASWSTPSIALPSGTTVITITARDAAGTAGVATFTVTSTVAAKTSPTLAPATSPSLAGTTSSVTSTSLSVESATSTAGYDEPSTTTAPVTSKQPVVQQTSAPLNVPTSNSTPSPSRGTSSGAKDTAQPTKNEAPATPPVVRILVPTAAARFSTTAASLGLAGVASHASGISVVRWSTDKGDSGVAEGTSKWTIPGLAIKPGTTVITVTAAALSSGDMTNAVLTVVRPEPLPKLNISFPTADSQWTTGTGTVALRGTATENVTRVLWSSDSGGAGVATGTTAWAISGVALHEGVNRITVTAQDASGRTDRHVLTVTYRPQTGLTAGAAKLASGATAGLER